MEHNMQTAIGAAKELFFPRRCFFCKKYGELLCGDCQTLLDVSRRHRPDRNQKYLADIYAACSYENKYVQKLVRALKYKPFCKELSQPLAKLILGHFALSEINFDFGGWIIVPIPLAPKRLRWRGFNQAEAIARVLGRAWQIKVAANCLARIAETKNQADLGQAQRLENIKRVFACADNTPFEGKSVFLVDDVVTTGATMNECARVLSHKGATHIIGIAIARTDE
jgi:competence protein ComFC